MKAAPTKGKSSSQTLISESTGCPKVNSIRIGRHI